MRGLAKEKHLAMEVEIAQDVPHLVRGDASRLRQILINLLGNAIKFTEKGRIRVAVTCGGKKSGKIEIRFVIRDTGIGIDRQLQGMIFDSFTQGDNTIGRRYQGYRARTVDRPHALPADGR